MTKRATILGVLMVALLLVTAAPALANKADYSITLPVLGGDIFSSTKTVKASKDFGVRHKYSGGKRVHFTVCNTSGGEIGADHTIWPGGADAPTEDLWWNDSSSSKKIKVKLESDYWIMVHVLAEGTWVWNY